MAGRAGIPVWLPRGPAAVAVLLVLLMLAGCGEPGWAPDEPWWPIPHRP